MGTYYPSHNYGPEHAAALARMAADPDSSNPSRPAKPRKHEVSEAQLKANRENAKKSTGPRTEAGKARCALNALRHGLTGQVSALTEEDRTAREAFIQPLINHLHPEGPLETQIAHSIAEGHWRLNRIRATEDNIFALGHYGPAADIDVDHPELHAALTSARVFLESARDLERLTLYEQRIQRGIAKHMQELEALQATRGEARRRALEEAAQLLQVADFSGEPEPDGSEFSTGEIRRFILRKERLKAAAYHEKHYWNPRIDYPGSVSRAA